MPSNERMSPTKAAAAAPVEAAGACALLVLSGACSSSLKRGAQRCSTKQVSKSKERRRSERMTGAGRLSSLEVRRRECQVASGFAFRSVGAATMRGAMSSGGELPSSPPCLVSTAVIGGLVVCPNRVRPLETWETPTLAARLARLRSGVCEREPWTSSSPPILKF
jgi:hypothetical protein